MNTESALSTKSLGETTASPESIRQVAAEPRFETRRRTTDGHRSLHAREAFHAGQILSDFSMSRREDEPSYLTVQVSEDEHVRLIPSHLELINHSCDPNVFFDVETRKLVALKDLAVGEELVFFYPSTEWLMVQPFQCLCGSKDCLGVIQGASLLSEEEALRYDINPHIRALMRQASTVAA